VSEPVILSAIVCLLESYCYCLVPSEFIESRAYYWLLFAPLRVVIERYL
jgi:hypothetical protein